LLIFVPNTALLLDALIAASSGGFLYTYVFCYTARMHIVVPHKFTQDEAVTKIKQALAQAKGQIERNAQDVTTSWDQSTLTFAFTAQGSRIKGTLQVLDKEFVLDATLPLMWRLFEGRIEKAIKEQLAQHQALP
jgi:hypothetical protein